METSTKVTVTHFDKLVNGNCMLTAHDIALGTPIVRSVTHYKAS